MACDCCPSPGTPGPTTGTPCCAGGGVTTGTPCPCCIGDCCCGLSVLCSRNLTVTLSNATDATLNGATGTFTPTGITPDGACNWTGSFSGISTGVTLSCSTTPTRCWAFAMTRGAGCTYSAPTAQVLDCANCTVTLKGITGAGINCEGFTLTVTITWSPCP